MLGAGLCPNCRYGNPVSRPIFDDPKGIGGASGFTYFVSAVCVSTTGAFPGMLLVGKFSIFLCPLRLKHRFFQLIPLSIGYASMHGGLLALMYSDPGHDIEWYFD
jgi:hypothetical protein